MEQDWERRFEDERDRRYSELRALDRETMNLISLDVTALREQIGAKLARTDYEREHGALIDKMETALEPLKTFMAAQQGQRSGSLDARSLVYGVAIVIVGIVAAVSPHIH